MITKKFRKLIFIDALFDTLFGTLMDINPDWTDNLNHTGYHKRWHNYLTDFDAAIDMTVVRERFANRDMDVLKKSFINQVPMWLNPAVRYNATLDSEHPEKRDIEITINYWPYAMSQSEIDDLANHLAPMFGLDDINRLKFVYIPLEDFRPTFINSRYEHFVIWDLLAWENIHLDELSKNPMPDVGCTAPLIVHDNMRVEGKNQLAEIAEILKLSHLMALHLDVVTLEVFSYINPNR